MYKVIGSFLATFLLLICLISSLLIKIPFFILMVFCSTKICSDGGYTSLIDLFMAYL